MALEDKHQQQQPDGIETSQSSPQSVLTILTEIIVEILSRLPVDSLLRCRSVCKLWRSLISNHHFVNSHLTLSTRNNHYAHHRVIFSTSRRRILKTFNLYDALYDSSVNALKLDYPFKRPRKSVGIVGSCNGLLCISIEDDTLFIWNPSTRKSNSLPSYGYKARVWSTHYGFGYEESTDDYKVVEICVKFKERYKCETFVKMYSLRNGNWKNIGAFPQMPGDYYGKCLNGALHWVANGDLEWTASEVVIVSYDWNIISLDLATETYGEVLQPVYDEGDKDLTLGSLREWLCVLCNYRGIRADLWVMKVYGVKDSWTKLVSIPYLTDPETDKFSVPLCISNDGKILLQLGSKLIVYDSKNGSFSENQNFDKCVQASTFVESLVSPIPAAGLGDRF
ncbi:hypothetical protein L1987_04516 [Smallanthus sonchifolius]|uniref:Uncharacterized protein n=1 Tax=Smallanthus sonchifolius TaxID=185202 RepID=A0ACB9JSZ2_9ASTR|nr:hypothetical protein L1987_04516 [Smallanthus sonchifolius]